MVANIKRFWFWELGVLFGIILPLILNLLRISAFHKVLWLLLLVNGVYAIYSGQRLAKENLSVWRVLFFPAMFALGTFVFHDVAHQYAYYLAIGYVCVSYMAYLWRLGLTTERTN